MRTTWLPTSTLGVVMRFFIPPGTEEKNRQERFKVLENAIARVLGTKMVKLITIIIPRDPREKTIDDGESKRHIIEKWLKKGGCFNRQGKFIEVQEVKENAYLNDGLICTGFALQLRRGITRTISLSPELAQFFEKNTLKGFTETAKQNVVVTQLSSDLLGTTEKTGYSDNAFCMYDNLALMSSGAFHHDGRYNRFGKNTAIPYAGGDAVIATHRIATLYHQGKTVAFVPYLGSQNAEYVSALDPEREKVKFGRKPLANELALESIGASVETIKESIMHC